MYTFIIADDEKAIRESIPKVIDFEKYGFSLCGTARDGEEALRKSQLLHPDLVLLDIRMPGLDGIGYLEQLRKYGLQDIKVAILSGYSDFDYAKKALQYGARGYFTKPLDEDEFTEFLIEIKDELDRKNDTDKREWMHTKAYQLKRMYLDGNGEREGYREFKMLHLVALHHTSSEKVCSRMEECLREVLGEEVELLLSKGGVYSFLCTKLSIEIQDRINETVLSHVRNRLMMQGIECAILVDDRLFEQIENTFRTDFDSHLYSMLTDIYWETGNCIIVNSRDVNSYKADYFQDMKSAILELKEAFGREDESEAFHLLDEIFDIAREKKIEYTAMVDIYYRIFYILKEYITDEKEGNNSLKAAKWQDSTCFITNRVMKAKCKEDIICLLRYRSETRKKQNQGVGEKAMEYIRQNYMKQIMLRDVADALYVNPAYLGRCIHKETGLSFNNVLAKLRIEKAKELLKNTDMMVYEIAEAVGYAESKHFVAKFTAMEGTAPLTYKKQLMKV